MNQQNKDLRPIDIETEIKVMKGLAETLDAVMHKLGGGLTVTDSADLNALALLLVEVNEQRKSLEKQEKALKAEVKRHFADGSKILDLADVLVILDSSKTSSLDRDALVRDFGVDVIEKYTKTTHYDKVLVKVK